MITCVSFVLALSSKTKQMHTWAKTKSIDLFLVGVTCRGGAILASTSTEYIESKPVFIKGRLSTKK